MDGTRLRSAAYPVRLALVRLRAAPGRAALVALGIAAGAAMLALAAGGSAAVRDRAVSQELARIGPSDSSLQVVWSGVPAQASASVSSLDSEARRALTSIVPGRPFGVSLFRQAQFGGALVNLGGVDGLRSWVRLRSGRLPRRCTAQQCELVLVGGSGRLPRLPFLHVVGRGALTNDAPLTAYFGDRGGSGPPLLLAEGALALGRAPLPDAELIARTFGWVLPIAPGSLHDWEIPGLARQVDREAVRLAAVDPVFSVSAPLDSLASVHAKARVAGERLLLIGGDVAVLLLAFAVLAAARRRRDTDDARRRLTWSGARWSQLATFTAVEPALVALVAVCVGWAAGALFAALLAHSLDTDAAPALAHSLLSGRGLALAALLAIVSAAVVVASLRASVASFGGWSLTTADVAAVGAIAAVLLAVARGDTSADSVGGGTGAFLLLLPALVVFAAAVLAARLLAPVFRMLGRAHGPLPVRLAAVSLARRGGTAIVASAFLVVSVGVALFAVSYRATLERGQRDQAAFAVPADYVLSENLDRFVPLQGVAPRAFARLGDTVTVARAAADARGRDVTLLALPAQAVPRLNGWRRRPTAQLGPSARLRGLDLHSRRFTLPFMLHGGPVVLTLDVLKPRGDFAAVELGTATPGTHVLHANVPVGGRAVALRLGYPPIAAFLAGHRESGTTLSVSNASRGVLTLRAPFSSWIGSGGVRVEGGRIRYIVNRAAVSLLRPKQTTDGVPVPVLATPGIAALGDVVSLKVNDAPLTVQVAGRVPLVPSVDGEAIVADRDRVMTAVNAVRPGTLRPNEAWVLRARPDARQQLARPPLNRLAVASRTAQLRELRSDPLARGTLAILGATALAALVLALVGLLLIVVTDLRDETGELFDLRAQGVSARELRRYLRVRAALVAVAGVVGGVVTGAILVSLVSSVVSVTAGATTPVPPLVVSLDWPILFFGFVAFLAAATLVVGAASSRTPA
ncbi:MAG: FtsX-like permease family protein [Gaiellaceae bacterium]